MQGSTKAAAMLDLWASVKRARGGAPRDEADGEEREAPTRRRDAPAAGIPTAHPAPE